MNDYHNGDNLGMEPHVQDDYTITVSPDPRGLHVAVHRGSRCVHSEVVAVQVREAAEPSDDEIDAIAASMADGAGGMLKQWGYRQFARALLARYGAQPVTRTEPSSGLGTIEYSVRAPETTKAFSDPAVRAAWTLGPVSDTQPKRRT